MKIMFYQNMFRVKDNKFVFCVLQKVIQSSLQKANELGIHINHIVHKVFRLNV